MYIKSFRKVTAYLLLVTTILYLITGFGITRARLVSVWTFDILNKVVCFRIHENLGIPFLVILLFHLVLSSLVRRGSKTER